MSTRLLAAIPCVTCHRDGRVTYWDPRGQTWVERAKDIPEVAMAVLPPDEVERVRRHLERSTP